MLERRALDVLLEAMLPEEAFYVPAHRHVVRAVAELAAKGRPVDQLTVMAEMRRQGVLDDAGGDRLIERLVLDTPTAAHVGFYLESVTGCWLRRQVIERAYEVSAEGWQGEQEDVQGWVRGVPERFAGFWAREQTEASNGEVLDGLIQKWEDAKRYREGDLTKAPAIGMRTPWDAATQMLCGLETGLVILAGRPSAGKTTLEDCISVQVAEKYGAVARATLDSSRGALLARAACRRAGVSLAKLKFGFAREDQLEELRRAKRELQELPLFIRNDLSDIADVCAWARSMKRKHGIRMLTLDYAQQFGARELGRAQTDRVAVMTAVSGRLKKLAYQLDIPVLLLSQLSRSGEQAGRKEPLMSDLRDSGSLEQDADKIVFCYVDAKKRKAMEDPKDGGRPDATKHKRPVCFHVIKHKDGETGTVELWMYPPYFRIEEAEEDWGDDSLPGDQDEVRREWGVRPEMLPADEEGPPPTQQQGEFGR